MPPPKRTLSPCNYCVKKLGVLTMKIFFWLVAAWVKSRAERPSVSGVNRQLHVQIGCKLRIRNRKDELTKQAKRNKLEIQIKPEGNLKG